MTTAFYPQHDDIRIAEVLHLLNPPERYALWHGGPSVTDCLEGVDAEQARWSASPNTRSIWHFVLHISFWKNYVRQQVTSRNDILFTRSPDNFPSPADPPSSESWELDVALLRFENQALIEAVRELDPNELHRPFPSGNRLLDQITGIALHDAYHVAQIQLLKRLYEDRQTRS